MTVDTVITFVVVWLICGVISAAIGQRKNLPVGESFLWGALLGIIGTTSPNAIDHHPSE